MRTSSTLHRRRLLAATALVCILLVLPFTATYGRVAGLVEQGLYVLALLLDVIALRLLFTTPTARTDRCASTRPQGALPRRPERPFGHCDEIGTAAWYTSMCRSHDVTGFSATTMSSVGARLQRFDPPEERTDSEVVGKRLPVLIAGSPDLLPVGGVQPGVVPYDCPGCGSLAAPGRADR